MRIISKFRDFYDTALKHGHDTSRVYIRETKDFDLDTADRVGISREKLTRLVESLWSSMPSTWSRQRDGQGLYVQVYPAVVLFAGKVVPLARVTLSRSPHYHLTPYGLNEQALLPQGDKVLYAVDALFETLEGLLGPGKGMSDEQKTSLMALRNNKSGARTVKQSWIQFFEQKSSALAMELTVELELPVLLVPGHNKTLTLNPTLADLQFFRKMSPEQAYQELDMFLGNLARPDRVPVELEDKYRIPQHGFDAMSFRKEPQLSRAKKRALQSKNTKG